MRSDLRSVRARLGVARGNQRASQRALAQRLNEIYRARPLDTLGVLLASRSFADISDGLDLLDRLSRADSSLVRSARRWRSALEGQSRTLRAAEQRAQAEQAPGRRAWPSCGAPTARSARCWQAAARARARAGGARRRPPGAMSCARARSSGPSRTAAAATPRRFRRRPPAPSLAAGSTLSVSSTAYSLPGHTASGLPVGQGICATDPRVIPLGTRFDVPGYGSAWPPTRARVIGATIDIWMPDAQAAVYGSQTITITFR